MATSSWKIVNLAGLPLMWNAVSLTLTVPKGDDATQFSRRRDAWAALKLAVIDAELRKMYDVRHFA